MSESNEARDALEIVGWRRPDIGDVVVPLGSTVDHAAVAEAKRAVPPYLESRLLSVRRRIRQARGFHVVWVGAWPWRKNT